MLADTEVERGFLRTRLAKLGFKNYNEYLRSDHWREVKESQPDRFCTWCKKTSGLHLHHQTYKRLGAEEVEDLVWLCSLHHWAIHQRKRKSLHARPGKYKAGD